MLFASENKKASQKDSFLIFFAEFLAARAGIEAPAQGFPTSASRPAIARLCREAAPRCLHGQARGLLRRLAVYGSANRYRPETNMRKSGGSGEYVIHGDGSARSMALAAKLAITVKVKTMDSQRWPCRIEWPQFMMVAANATWLRPRSFSSHCLTGRESRHPPVRSGPRAPA